MIEMQHQDRVEAGSVVDGSVVAGSVVDGTLELDLVIYKSSLPSETFGRNEVTQFFSDLYRMRLES